MADWRGGFRQDDEDYIWCVLNWLARKIEVKGVDSLGAGALRDHRQVADGTKAGEWAQG